MWRRVVWCIVNVQDERVASIFRVGQLAVRGGGDSVISPIDFSYAVYSSTLTMEAARYSVALETIYRTTRRQIPEDSNLHILILSHTQMRKFKFT
jgi:hypothetical protein